MIICTVFFCTAEVSNVPSLQGKEEKLQLLLLLTCKIGLSDYQKAQEENQGPTSEHTA